MVLCGMVWYGMVWYGMAWHGMLCYAMLCYAMLCYAMLCYAMLCYAMLCYAMLCYAIVWYDMVWYCSIILIFIFFYLQYKNDLATDYEIFAERTKESDSLRDRIKELEQENVSLSEQLKDVLDKLKKHDDQLLRQQVQLNKQLTPRENGFAEGMKLLEIFDLVIVVRKNWISLGFLP